ncbi:LTA synthase family protein [Fictibacillus iocasae]|uniref:LTA synthase family protein n=1 Tax=Fictibacillus iocasae TaxID=2715437 RepID=A0ABW2NRI9_9BACL
MSGYFKKLYSMLFEGAQFATVMNAIFLVSLGAGLLLSFWVFFLSRRKRLIALFVLNAVLSFVILSDLLYYRFFWDLVSLDVLYQIGQVSSLGSSIFELFRWSDLWFVADTIVFLPILILVLRKMESSAFTWPRFFRRLTAGTAVFAIGSTLFFYPLYYYISSMNGLLLKKTLSNVHIYNVTGLFGFHAFDVYRSVKRMSAQGEALPASQASELETWFQSHQATLEEPTDYQGIAKDKNVILIQLEAFQTFVLNNKVNGEEITPNLNELLKTSVYFPNFYHQTGNGRTSDAEFAANNSLYPVSTGSAYVKYPRNRYHSLPEILKDNGYETTVFHAYKPGFWNRHVMYNNISFDKFYSDKYFSGPKIGWSTNDRDFFLQSADMMKDLNEPFYSFLISITSHYPFEIPDNLKKLNVDGFENEVFKNYLHTVHYTDEALGLFFQKLKQDGLWENSIILLYGDHDSGLITPGSEALKFAGGSDSDLDVNRVRASVPLIVHLPNENKKTELPRAGGQIDLSPTITHLLGIQSDKNYRMGDNLFRDNGIVSFRNNSFTDGNHYFVPDADDSRFEQGHCYDFKSRSTADLSLCEEGYKETELRLKLSDLILERDYLK